jgi:hypothetical protein
MIDTLEEPVQTPEIRFARSQKSNVVLAGTKNEGVPVKWIPELSELLAVAPLMAK